MRSENSILGQHLGRLQSRKFLERPWLLVPLAVIVALVSGFLLWAVLKNDYWDYWLWPKLKAADPGLYIYPQLRYTLFDMVLLLWCLDGLVASGMTLWGLASRRGIGRWAYRTIGLYVALLVVLILGGSLMFYVRSRGY
jgi:hypothetical protein